MELDTTFHAVPTAGRVRRWADASPDDFRFCVKTPKDVTHADGRLSAPERVDTMLRFVESAREFGGKLGVVLLQFPPSFDDGEAGELGTLIGKLPDDIRYAVEFRHLSWDAGATAGLLRQFGCGWVAGDYLARDPRPIDATADFLYVRWVGRHGQHPTLDRERIDVPERLAWWKRRIEACGDIKTVSAPPCKGGRLGRGPQISVTPGGAGIRPQGGIRRARNRGSIPPALPIEPVVGGALRAAWDFRGTLTKSRPFMVDRSHLLRAAALAAITLSGCSSPADKGGQSPAASGARRGPAGPSSGFEAARRDPPIAAETRFAAGQLAESRGAFAQAVEQYRQTVRIDPKHDRALFHLGVAYAEMKKYPEAVDTWKRYIKVTGESPQAYGNLGFCYELWGRPEEAEAAYQKGLKKDPASVPCRVNYGLMLVRRGRVGEGRLQLAAVLKPAEVHYNVGSVYESQGLKEQAKAEYSAALRLDPRFADAGKRLDELECGPADGATRPGAVTGLSKTE